MKSKTFQRNRRFFTAIVIAAIYSIDRLTFREVLSAFKMVVIAITARKSDLVSKSVYYRRMKHCMRCPLWVPLLSTCGSPVVTGDSGCGCYMPKKCLLKTATCWANHNTDLEFGWPKKLELE